MHFAEYPLDPERLSQKSSFSKWYVGLAVVKPMVKYDVLFTTRSESKIINEARHTLITDRRKAKVRVSIQNLRDVARLGQELTSAQEGSTTKKSSQGSAHLENLSLSRYSSMLSESVLENERLHFQVLNDSDDRKGVLSKEMLRDFENSQLEQIIDSRYDSASMTDLAVTEFQRALTANFPNIMAMYAEVLTQISQEQYPFISQT